MILPKKMPLPEIEFELPAIQHKRMGFATLKQGESMPLILDAGVLLPNISAEQWFTVQKEPINSHLSRFGPAQYAFSGQIQEADIIKEGGLESAILEVSCGGLPLRMTCAPQGDGLLPFGTWETRYLTGISRLQGIVEEPYHTSIGTIVNVTIWQIRRLVLTPGDPVFGQWHETDELSSSPYKHDRIYITARVHRSI